MNDLQRGLITLIKSAVTGKSLTLPEGFCLDDAKEIILKQHLSALVYEGAINCGLPEDSLLMRQLQRAYYQLLIKSERQMIAVGKIYKAFEEGKIDYLPIKGCNMKSLYPKPELRLMGDADILIRDEQYDRVHAAMEGAGFVFAKRYDNVYEWDNDSLHVELHSNLSPSGDESFGDYYESGWEFAIKGEGTRYDMSSSDAFVYLFSHFAKHYRIAGIGCRHVLDLFVYLNKIEIDAPYVRGELEKLGFGEFYYNMLRVLDNWFSGGKPDEITDIITDYILGSGSWGNTKTAMYSKALMRASDKASGASKLKTVFLTVFTPLKDLRKVYWGLHKAPILLPIYWVVHWFDILLHRPENIKKKTKALASVNNESVEARRRELALVGLGFDKNSDKE